MDGDPRAAERARLPRAVAATIDAVNDMAHRAFVSRKSGLPNAAALELYAAEYDRTPSVKVAAVYVDLSGFKRLNDDFGHEAGDVALRLAGHMMTEISSKFAGTQSFHLSGDEFLILAPVEHLDDLVGHSFGLMRRVSFQFKGRPAAFKSSFGYCRPSENASIALLVERADLACRVAKQRESAAAVEWAADLALEKSHEQRQRCDACSATIDLSVPESRRREQCLASCPNCGASLSPDTSEKVVPSES